MIILINMQTEYQIVAMLYLTLKGIFVKEITSVVMLNKSNVNCTLKMDLFLHFPIAERIFIVRYIKEEIEFDISVLLHYPLCSLLTFLSLLVG